MHTRVEKGGGGTLNKLCLGTYWNVYDVLYDNEIYQNKNSRKHKISSMFFKNRCEKTIVVQNITNLLKIVVIFFGCGEKGKSYLN